MISSQANLYLFEQNPDEFLHRFITVYEGLIYFYTGGDNIEPRSGSAPEDQGGSIKQTK